MDVAFQKARWAAGRQSHEPWPGASLSTNNSRATGEKRGKDKMEMMLPQLADTSHLSLSLGIPLVISADQRATAFCYHARDVKNCRARDIRTTAPAPVACQNIVRSSLRHLHSTSSYHQNVGIANLQHVGPEEECRGGAGDFCSQRW